MSVILPPPETIFIIIHNFGDGPIVYRVFIIGIGGDPYGSEALVQLDNFRKGTAWRVPDNKGSNIWVPVNSVKIADQNGNPFIDQEAMRKRVRFINQ